MRFRGPAGPKGQRRNYSQITTRNYLRVVSDFAKHFGKSPDKLGPNELRTYQAYLLRERKLTPGTAVNCVAARERELLTTSYFHVVFTVPHELNVLALENPRLFYDL